MYTLPSYYTLDLYHPTFFITQQKHIKTAYRNIYSHMDSHRFGCKRPLLSNDFYSALNRDNVELITDPVTAITKTGIRSKNVDSGVIEDREVDVLIWATGK